MRWGHDPFITFVIPHALDRRSSPPVNLLPHSIASRSPVKDPPLWIPHHISRPSTMSASDCFCCVIAGQTSAATEQTEGLVVSGFRL